MDMIRLAFKWAGITLGLAMLTICGFAVAAWLSPGISERSYAIAGLSFAALAIVFRLLFPDNHERPD